MRNNSTQTPSPSSASVEAATSASSASNATTSTADLLVDPPPFTTEAITEAAHAIGTLKELGLAKWYTPPGLLQQLLELIHVSTGLQWIATIAVATVMIRVTFFPLMLRSIRNTSKLAIINPQVKEEMAKLRKATSEGDKMEAMRAQMTVQKLFKDNNVNPLMSVIPIFVQMPIFVSFYMALNGMVSLPVPGLEHGGLLWFNDLTASDPLHILPITTAALTLINFEIGAEVGASQGTQMNPAIRNIFRLFMCVMPMFTWNFSTAVFGYWFTSSLFSLCQGFAFRSPAIRARLRLPPMPPKVSTPVATPAALTTSANSAAGTAAGTLAGTAPAASKLTGGFWKNFNETVQGVKDMKAGITEKAERAAQQAAERTAQEMKRPSKLEDMPPAVRARKLRQQERVARAKKLR
ncbi:hypothetical protein PYCC9005_000344 [Savitreella phatthalungensis]